MKRRNPNGDWGWRGGLSRDQKPAPITAVNSRFDYIKRYGGDGWLPQEPATFDPSQPERNLYAAILKRAIDDLDLNANPTIDTDLAQARALAVNVKEWIEYTALPAHGGGPIVTFEECCDVLGIDSATIKNVLARRGLLYASGPAQ